MGSSHRSRLVVVVEHTPDKRVIVKIRRTDVPRSCPSVCKRHRETTTKVNSKWTFVELTELVVIDVLLRMNVTEHPKTLIGEATSRLPCQVGDRKPDFEPHRENTM